MPESTSLGRALRAARVASGVSGTELARRLGPEWNQTRVSRAERGERILEPEEIQAWTQALGLTPEQAAQIAAEAVHLILAPIEETQTEGLEQRQRDMGALRQSMTAFAEVSVAMVPGLLQTPAYALKIMQRLASLTGMIDVEAAVAQRLNNQAILFDDSRTFRFIISSWGLRFPAGPASALRAQAEKITGLMELPNVDVMVLPGDAAPDLPLFSGWVLYDVPDNPTVLVELLGSEAWITGPQVDLYRAAFDVLAKVAVTGDKAAALIRETMTG
jgi:transcriptional regulator with XRE-family HTH domain